MQRKTLCFEFDCVWRVESGLRNLSWDNCNHCNFDGRNTLIISNLPEEFPGAGCLSKKKHLVLMWIMWGSMMVVVFAGLSSTPPPPEGGDGLGKVSMGQLRGEKGHG